MRAPDFTTICIGDLKLSKQKSRGIAQTRTSIFLNGTQRPKRLELTSRQCTGRYMRRAGTKWPRESALPKSTSARLVLGKPGLENICSCTFGPTTFRREHNNTTR